MLLSSDVFWRSHFLVRAAARMVWTSPFGLRRNPYHQVRWHNAYSLTAPGSALAQVRTMIWCRSIADPNESAGNEYPPTAAGQFSVEWGRPLFWAGVIIAIVMIVKLVRAGLNRGRDSFYPAAGASALAVLLISAFGNPGLTGATTLILSGAVLGLALAQSRSRAVQ